MEEFDPLTVTIFLAKAQNVYFGLSYVVITEEVFIEAGDVGVCHFEVNGDFEDLVPNWLLSRPVGGVCAILNSIVDYLDVGVHVSKYFGIAKEFALRNLQTQLSN
jgi:hypothetical protein